MTELHVSDPGDARLRMYDGLPQDRDASENAGYVMLARTPDADLLLWTSVYAITGRGAGQWIVPDGRMQGTLLLAVPHDGPASIHDNDFARAGMHFSEILEPIEHEIVLDGDRAEWIVGNRQYIWAPPVWMVRGEHAGVDLDLVFSASGAAQWRWGGWDELTENDSAGFEVGTKVNGRITVAGITYEVVDAPGFHERPAVGESRDVVRELTGGVEFTSAIFFTDAFKVSLSSHSGRNIQMGTIEMADHTLAFMPFADRGSASIDILERWHDPRSGLSVPAEWSASLASEEGRLDVHLQARARGYFHYLTKGGVMILMWILARADGVLTLPDGTVHAIDDAPVAARWGRNLLVAHEQLAQP